MSDNYDNEIESMVEDYDNDDVFSDINDDDNKEEQLKKKNDDVNEDD